MPENPNAIINRLAREVQEIDNHIYQLRKLREQKQGRLDNLRLLQKREAWTPPSSE